jgi:glutamate racemase
MENQNPIGLFDSGIGGVTIWKAIHELMPNENTIYLADSIKAPYGQKSKSEIIDLCFKNVAFLCAKNAKIVVVACNTATTNAIKEMRAHFDIPVVGIEPAIKPAVANSKTQTIGILATKGTLNSELFSHSLKLYHQTKIIEQVGHGLVQLIENGDTESEEMTDLLKTYLQPMIAANIDYLVLGCSHYPFLIPQIQKILPPNITIIDSGEAVARQTFSVLSSNSLLNNSVDKSKNIFYTNSNPKVLNQILGFKYQVISEEF